MFSQPSTQDQEFERRLRAGDESVLDDALRLCEADIRERLRTHFPRSLQDNDLDDVMATGLYRVWHYRLAYEAERSPFAAWFYVLCRSAAFDLLRRIPRVTLLSSQELATRSEAVSKPHEASSPPRRLQDLERALESLSELDQTVLKRFAAAPDDNNWSEALAKELRMPAATIRSRKARALKRLKTITNPAPPAAE